MVDLPTRLDLYAIGRSHVRARAKKLDPKQVDIRGSDANIVVGSGSYMAYEAIKVLAQAVNTLLLDGATGEDLDRFAYDRYDGLTRNGAQAAVTSVQFFRSGTTYGAGTVPDGTRVVSLTGIEYITTTTATFAALDVQASADVRAVMAGSATQVGANTLRRIANPSLLWDPSLQVTNAEAAVGGLDRESDEHFRERIRDYFGTARRGTIGAIETGALTVGGVDSSLASEVLNPDSTPSRLVRLSVADGSGTSNRVLGAMVDAALLEYRAAGIHVVIDTSLPQLVTVKLKLAFKANVDTSALTERVKAAVLEYVNSLGVGQTLYKSELYSLLIMFKSDGLIADNNTIVEPVGDLVPDEGRTLRMVPAGVQVL